MTKFAFSTSFTVLKDRIRLAMVTGLAGLVLSVQPVSAQVIWEDYQGNVSMFGSSNQDLPGISYGNNLSSALPRLKSISVDPSASPSRTGTSTQINYLASPPTLCNLVADAAGTSAACQADAMGRVLWAPIRFPSAGNYTFQLAHDDGVDVDLSSTFNTNAYKTISYDIPVGGLAAYTSGETTYEAIPTTVVSPMANSCGWMRVY